ncbi:MAG: T9SS type A sorting domain-containing protein, partial [Saprospiraceae bacterium]
MLSSTPSTQENVFLRYSTNNFSTYGTLLNPTSGAGTSTQTFTIPAQPNNTNVKYYILTSTLANGSLTGQSSLTDMATLNFDNNGGANYGYVSLPIELTEFQAVKAGHAVNLQWTTATEQNNDHFEVERSSNGADWTMLTILPTKNGNARYPQNYQTTDANPQPARNYYRLRQVDTDGRASYSAVRIVEMGVESIASVAPNPIENGLLQLTLTGSPSPNQVRLTDSQGRLLRSWTFEMETSGTVPLDLSDFPKGVMFLQVNAEPVLRVVKL